MIQLSYFPADPILRKSCLPIGVLLAASWWNTSASGFPSSSSCTGGPADRDPEAKRDLNNPRVSNSYPKRTRLKYTPHFSSSSRVGSLIRGLLFRNWHTGWNLTTIWDNFYYFFFFFFFFFLILFSCFVTILLSFSPFLCYFSFFPMFCYCPLFFDIRFIIFYSRKLLCFLFVFIIISFLTPLIRCPLIGLPILT